MLFTQLKRIIKLDRLWLRGIAWVSDECTLAATVQNLRRLAKQTTQAPPTEGIERPLDAKAAGLLKNPVPLRRDPAARSHGRPAIRPVRHSSWTRQCR
jgi:hypothetical protein